PTVPLVGGYAGTLNGGALDNGGEEVRLARPDGPQPDNFVPYLLVDEVDYNDTAPWPTSPDGDGASLTRLSTLAYGQDPAHWTGADPSPGVATIPPPLTIINGTSGPDVYHVIRFGSELHIYENIPPV